MARRISPALADLSQDIAGSIPVDLILRWATGQKNLPLHNQLLNPHKIQGTVVSSDSAGLSKLSEQKTLLEVLHLVSKPKEIIYAYGRKIGGEAIGMWIADNTQMFYASHIHPQTILEQMLGAQQEINELPVKVGIGIHNGEFIDIGGGLFGEEANYIEEVSENYTEGGEIVVSHTIRSQLEPSLAKLLALRADLKFKLPVYRFHYQNMKSAAVKDTDSFYPHPFDQEFFEYLTQTQFDDPEIRTKINSKYLIDTTVLLVKVHHRKRRFLLDQLTDWVIVNSIINKQLKDESINKVKSNGSLGIFTGNDNKALIEFAQELGERLQDAKFTATFAVAKGDVLIFPISETVKEIAGSPVNIASKLAEDVGEKNGLYIEDSVEAPPSFMQMQKSEPFSATVSGIELTGRMIKSAA